MRTQVVPGSPALLGPLLCELLSGPAAVLREPHPSSSSGPSLTAPCVGQGSGRTAADTWLCLRSYPCFD